MRILYYLNVSTDPKFIVSDSGFHVMRQLIEAVNKKRNDVFWYVVAPKETEKVLKTERTKVLPYPFSNWAVTNRYHFDFINFRKVFSLDYDIDLMFNSQPELTANFYSIFNLPGRDERFKVPIINYLHWLAVPETMKYQKTTFVRQVESIILSEFTGLNSEWAKNIFLNNIERMRKDSLFKYFFNEITYSLIKDKLNPLTLGTPLEEIDKYKDLKADELTKDSKERIELQKLFETVESTPTIVFNHRLMNYTGAEFFIKYIKRLSKEYSGKFLVWLTDPNFKSFFESEKLEVIPNLLRTEVLPWKAYIALLSKCRFSTACHPSYSAWSLSCVDTMSVARPVLVPRAFAFSDIVGENYPFYFGTNIDERETIWLYRARDLLEHEDVARKVGSECRKRVETLFDWKTVVDIYLKLFDKTINNDFGEETDSMKELQKLIISKGVISKHDIFNAMGWSFDLNGKVTWNRYRNFLRASGFTEDFNSPLVFFRTTDKSGQRLLFDSTKVQPTEREETIELELEAEVTEETLAYKEEGFTYRNILADDKTLLAVLYYNNNNIHIVLHSNINISFQDTNVIRMLFFDRILEKMVKEDEELVKTNFIPKNLAINYKIMKSGDNITEILINNYNVASKSNHVSRLDEITSALRWSLNKQYIMNRENKKDELELELE